MGKADRKRKLRQRKQAIPPIPELADTPRRTRNGSYQHNVERNEADRNPQGIALKARARQMGYPETKDGQLAMKRQCMECDQGRVIYLMHKGNDDRIARLWGTYAKLDAAEEAYHRRYIGQRRFPKTAKIEMMPERFETLPDESNDLRSQDEKDRDAVNGWMKWQGHLGYLSAGQQSVIQQALRGAGGRLIDDRTPTDTGRAFVEALAALSDVVESR